MTLDQHRVGLTSFLTILGVRWMFIFPLYRINYRECGRSALDLPFKNQYRIIWAFPFKNILRSGTLFQSTRNIKIFILIVNKISFWAHLPKHWRFSWPYLTRHLDIPIWPSFLCSLFTVWNMNVNLSVYFIFCLIKSIKFYFCSIYAGKR